MGLQENKTATQDFLSLYTNSSSPCQLQETKSNPQDLFVSTRDFLRPLDRAVDANNPDNVPAAAGAGVARKEPALQGGISAFSIGNVVQPQPLPGGFGVVGGVVKAELAPCSVVAPGKVKKKAEKERHPSAGGAPAFALWVQPSAAADSGSNGRWSLPFAAGANSRAAVAAASISSSAPRHQLQPAATVPETKRRGGFMDSGSRSVLGSGFDDDDFDGDDFSTRREVSSALHDLAVRVDAKGAGSCSGSGTEQRPSTPRSKHSATEQRRRSKINDRFQILRELLPQNDQKRDKASFLLEVIEYIRHLQDKVQKYEGLLPEWNEENSKLTPWSNIYFRSLWKNAQNKTQGLGLETMDPSQSQKDGLTPSEYICSGKFGDNQNAVTTGAVADVHDRIESNPVASVSYQAAETPNDLANNFQSNPQESWVGTSGGNESATDKEIINGSDLIVDEGTISVSAQYSQQLLNSLKQALQNSGVDLSEARVSVQISLGRRAAERSSADGSYISKEDADLASSNQLAGQLRLGGASHQDLNHIAKRHKPDNH